MEDPIQMTETVTCGLFQMYFYENLFYPYEKSKIQNNKKLTKETMETLLNELSTLGKGKNEQLMEQFAKDYDITVQYTRQNNDDLFHTQQLLVYLIWLTLDR